jgi:hypothetical protein
MDLMDLDPVTTEALYSPLDQDAFRLMILQPGQPTDPVSVELHAVSTNSTPEYDALSYVWGNPRDTVQILCNGLLTNVTVNLHAALVQIRSLQASMVLWADALCINQQDKQERSRQVAMMGSIYSGARLVLACMGSSPDRGAANIASLLQDYAPVMGKTAPPIFDPRWKSLGPLLRKDWFTRAWVLQEVGLARNPRVVYDHVDFSYRELMAAVKWLGTKASEFTHAHQTVIPSLLIHILWTDWSADWKTTNPEVAHHELLDLLDHGALLACQNPRDHIYAFLSHPLGRSNSSAGRGIIPDYEKEVGLVYKEVSELLLAETGTRMLSSVEHNESTLVDFSIPSWVVRWDVAYVLNNIHGHSHHSHRASGDRSVAKMSQQGDILRVCGLNADAVKDVYQMDLCDSTMKIVFKHQTTSQEGTLEDLLASLITPNMPCAYHHSRPLALALTLCVLERATVEFVAAWNAICTWYRAGPQSLLFRNLQNQALVHRFWVAMVAHCRGRALIVTEKGFYGLAAHTSRPGDLCCLFDGAAVPFLLRPVQGESKFSLTRLVGEAYIHGIMNGEASAMLERGEAGEQVFQII